MDMESNEIRIVRLMSGEEIICKTNALPDDCVEIRDPLILVPAREKGGLALAPWMPYTNVKEDGIVVSSDKVVFTTKAHPELEKEYLSALSGLVIPNAAESAQVAGTVGPQNLSE